MCETCGCGLHDHKDEEKKILHVFEDILKHNDEVAKHNREHLEKHKVLGLNLMSSPGAGKTTLLEKTLESLKEEYKIGVIEGDLETERDAERIRKLGVPVYQITTGTACHLSAEMIHKAMHHFNLDELDILIVENIGNLVCPANYELGTHYNIILLSVPEGDDKPEKYPVIFKTAHLVLITKIDLLPYFDFDLQKVKEMIRKINPNTQIFEVSAKTGQGMGKWLDFIKEKAFKNSK